MMDEEDYCAVLGCSAQSTSRLTCFIDARALLNMSIIKNMFEWLI